MSGMSDRPARRSARGSHLKIGDRVLVTGQPRRTWWQRLLRRKAATPQNGIYVVEASTSAVYGDAQP